MEILLVVFALIAAIPAVFIADGFITGEVQARGGSYSRADEPGWFWTMIGVYAAMIGCIALMAIEFSVSQ